MREDIAVVILAAGLGKRMKSDRAKVLHEVLGQPMILHVMAIAREIAGPRVVVVVGHQAEEARRAVLQRYEAVFAYQGTQLGTGHAVKCALPYLPRDTRDVVILYGDVPLLKPSTVDRLIEGHRATGCDISILAIRLQDPSGYGRIVCDPSGDVCGVVEEADADSRQKRVRRINTAIYCVDADFLTQALGELKAENAQGEFYLTDIVGIAYRSGRRIGVTEHGDAEEVQGVNTRIELAAAESAMVSRGRFKS
jgi:UDP-N-acetylglucosamine diphosphorylase/glucosamine-1-phosphate N-acetyltransferase